MSKSVCGDTHTASDRTVLTCTVAAGHAGSHQCYLGESLHEWTGGSE